MLRTDGGRVTNGQKVRQFFGNNRPHTRSRRCCWIAPPVMAAPRPFEHGFTHAMQKGNDRPAIRLPERHRASVHGLACSQRDLKQSRQQPLCGSSWILRLSAPFERDAYSSVQPRVLNFAEIYPESCLLSASLAARNSERAPGNSLSRATSRKSRLSPATRPAQSGGREPPRRE